MFGRFAAGGQFDEFAGPEVGPGVMGNMLPGPAFMPIRAAARAGSSVAAEGTTVGNGAAPAFELLGILVGSESVGGQAGIVSNGEPRLDGGTWPRVAFGNRFVDPLEIVDGIKSA